MYITCAEVTADSIAPSDTMSYAGIKSEFVFGVHSPYL